MPETPLPRLVRDLMTVGVMTCTLQTTVPELAQLLLDHDLDELVVEKLWVWWCRMTCLKPLPGTIPNRLQQVM
jgi:hypothetical protein